MKAGSLKRWSPRRGKERRSTLDTTIRAEVKPYILMECWGHREALVSISGGSSKFFQEDEYSWIQGDSSEAPKLRAFGYFRLALALSCVQCAGDRVPINFDATENAGHVQTYSRKRYDWGSVSASRVVSRQLLVTVHKKNESTATKSYERIPEKRYTMTKTLQEFNTNLVVLSTKKHR